MARTYYVLCEPPRLYYGRFFDAVFHRPAIWNHHHPLFEDQKITHMLWKEVACIVGKSKPREVKMDFLQKRRSYEKFLCGRLESWNYFDEMSFLGREITMLKRTTTKKRRRFGLENEPGDEMGVDQWKGAEHSASTETSHGANSQPASSENSGEMESLDSLLMLDDIDEEDEPEEEQPLEPAPVGAVASAGPPSTATLTTAAPPTAISAAPRPEATTMSSLPIGSEVAFAGSPPLFVPATATAAITGIIPPSAAATSSSSTHASAAEMGGDPAAITIPVTGGEKGEKKKEKEPVSPEMMAFAVQDMIYHVKNSSQLQEALVRLKTLPFVVKKVTLPRAAKRVEGGVVSSSSSVPPPKQPRKAPPALKEKKKEEPAAKQYKPEDHISHFSLPQGFLDGTNTTFCYKLPSACPPAVVSPSLVGASSASASASGAPVVKRGRGRPPLPATIRKREAAAAAALASLGHHPGSSPTVSSPLVSVPEAVTSARKPNRSAVPRRRYSP